MHHHHLVSPEVRAALAELLRIALGLLWLAAGIAKARQPKRVAEEAVHRLFPAPHTGVRIISVILPLTEVLLGVAMLIRWHVVPVAVASAVLFLLFGVLAFVATLRGVLSRSGGCGCFTFGSRPDEDHQRSSAENEVGVKVLARNVILAAAAFAVASQG